ncbi:MAG TPA: ELM1/GtrOC1 family putative glycosyltransferase, partial [Geminicoccaceae bacterium]|nr:ELM1/GtrOC1 family putative glycosyltransferase [Geminicoccaceae bacterium]
VPYQLFRWTREATDNPYFGYLALADAIVVTCESATMLAEACATRKPVYMFDLERDQEPGPAESWHARLRRHARRCNLQRLKAWLYREVFLRLAPSKITRDTTRVHELLLESGRAVWLGQPSPPGTPPASDDLARSVRAVRELLEQPATAATARPSLEPVSGSQALAAQR